MSLKKILRHFLILPFRLSRSKTKIIFEICPSAYSCEQKGVTGFQTLFLFWVYIMILRVWKAKSKFTYWQPISLRFILSRLGTIHTLFFRSTLVVMHIMLVACLAALVVGSSHLGLHPQSIFICIFFFSFFFFLFFFFLM